MTDFLLLEQLYKMIKGIPRPRLMFKKGIVLHGYFRPYMSLRDYTKSAIFEDADKVIPVIVRFQAMLGSGGTADTMRNIKGMNIKFLIDNNEYDMICQNIPVRFINDKEKLLDLFKIFYKREHFDGINIEEFWKFITENQEAINCAVRLYSYEGITQSYYFIKWYSVNTYRWVNNEGKESLVKYKWVPICDERELVAKRLDRNSAEFISGYEPDKAQNELLCKIKNKTFPTYELQIQLLHKKSSADSLWQKETLYWSEHKNPYMAVGQMVLDHMLPENKIDDDKLFFCPGNTVAGIELYRNTLTEIEEQMYRIEGIERGVI